MTETRIPSLAAVAEAAAVTEVASVRVCRAGRVVAYYYDTQTADVQVLPSDVVTLTDGTLAVVDAPILYGKPVAMPAGGGRSLTWGLEEGDLVYVVYRDVSHDEADQRRNGQTYTPQDPRRFDPSDAVVWPFGYPPSRMDGAPVLAFGAGEAFRVGAADAAQAVAIAAAVRDEMDARDTQVAAHSHTIGPLIASLTTGIVSAGGAGGVVSTVGTSYTAPTARALGSERLLTDDTVTPGTGVTT